MKVGLGHRLTIRLGVDDVVFCRCDCHDTHGDPRLFMGISTIPWRDQGLNSRVSMMVTQVAIMMPSSHLKLVCISALN